MSNEGYPVVGMFEPSVEALTKEYDKIALSQGSVAAFALKTTAFVGALFMVRLLQMSLIPSILEFLSIGAVTAAYCFSTRVYIKELVRAVTSCGLKGILLMAAATAGVLLLVLVLP